VQEISIYYAERRRLLFLIRKGKADIYRRLAAVAVPIALQSLIASSLNLVDNLMVGSLGEAQLASVGAGIQIFFIAWIITFGFSAGCSTFAAQFWGAGDMRNIRKTCGFAMTVCVGFGMLFFIAGFFFPEYIMRIFTNIPEIIAMGSRYVKYGALCFVLMPVSAVLQMTLKATQQTRAPLQISIVSFSMNTFMNWVLIFGHFGLPALGVRGAALATVIARVIEAALSIYIVLIRKNILNGRVGDFFGWSKDLMRRIAKNSVPTMANEGLWSLATTMYVAAYARVGVTEYAAYQACESIDRLFIMAAFSMGDAALILVGQKLGEKKTEEAYELAGTILRISVITGLIMGTMLIIFGKPLISLFNFSQAGQHDAFLMIIVYGVVLTADVLNGVIVTGVLRSGGDTRFAMLMDIGTIWLIGVPLAFFSTMVMHWPIYTAVLLTCSEHIVKLIIGLCRVRSKKWMNNVIGGL
jgi:putative MATE family efflux protein